MPRISTRKRFYRGADAEGASGMLKSDAPVQAQAQPRSDIDKTFERHGVVETNSRAQAWSALRHAVLMFV